MVYKLSPSAVNLFIECPRCFWLTHHKKWKRPNGIFPSLPSGMDKILKQHFDKFRDKGLLPPEICEEVHCKKMKLFGENNEKKKLLKQWQSNFVGIKYMDEKGNYWHGAVDNLLKNNEKLVVLDYKTRGFPLKEDTHEHYQFQMDTYNFLLRKNGWKTEDYTFLLFYVPSYVTKTGEVVFDTTLKKIKTNPENAEKIFLKAIECLEGKIPEGKCEWCEGVE